jgi:hypothetical protein
MDYEKIFSEFDELNAMSDYVDMMELSLFENNNSENNLTD